MTKQPPPPYDEKDRATAKRSQADAEALRTTADAVQESSAGHPEPRAGLWRLSLRGSVLSLRDSLASTLRREPDAAAVSRAQTLARMRAAEERARQMEQLVERLKRETYAGPTATEAELRILQLQYDSMRAGSAGGRRPSAGLFRTACSTDLLFLLDATSSMRESIRTAKDQIKSIVADISRAFFNEADVRVAVVAYRDHRDKKQFETLDFTTDTDQMFRFLDGVVAVGGDDAAEDVLGALDRAMRTSWQQATRCVMHITDAPPHGRALHDMQDRYDDYLEPGSEPHRLRHEDVVARMVALRLNYVLMRINRHTDKMAYVFLQGYRRAAPEARLLKTNKFYNDAVLLTANRLSIGACTLATETVGVDGSLVQTTTTTASGGLHFDEVELGSQYSAMRHLVVGSVKASASRTVVRLSAASSARWSGSMASGCTVQTRASAAPGLDAVSEADDDEEASETRRVRLETTPPQWNTAGWLESTEQFQAFSTDVAATPGQLDAMMDSDDNIRISTTELTVLRRSRPFAEGALRVAMYARTAESTNRLVVKAFKAGGSRNTLVAMAEEMRVQALCKAFALEFNALAVDAAASAIDFTVVTCLQPVAAARGSANSIDTCLALEPLLDGAFVKYNSNCGGVGADEPADDGSGSGSGSSSHGAAAQAFSHFTFERSRGRFLVCDLQGVGGVLTDPAVHTRDSARFRLTDTNLNQDGFKLFFATHQCNRLCLQLRLLSSADMFLAGPLVFRQDWPATLAATEAGAGPSVCCANKLCGRIFRADDARKTAPAFYWCTACWPQLAATTTNVLCLAPDPHHDFPVSRFFHESQGQIRPRLCPKHVVDAGFQTSIPASPVAQKNSRSFFGGRR